MDGASLPSRQMSYFLCPRGVLFRQLQRLVGVESPLGCLWALRHERWDRLGSAVLQVGRRWWLQHLAGVESPIGCIWPLRHERWAHLGLAVLWLNQRWRLQHLVGV